MRVSRKLVGIILTCSFIGLFACSEKAQSKINFIFKNGADLSVGIKVGEKVFTKAELFAGAEGEIFEAEQRVHQIKMDKIRERLMEHFMAQDPKKKGLSNEQYLEKHIVAGVKVTDADKQKFIKERKVPKEHQTPEFMERLDKFLIVQKKREQVEQWLAAQTQKTPVEVYVARPARPRKDVKIGSSPYLGKKDAKITLVEFSDFQCPHCQRGSKIMKEIKDKYGDKVKIVFKNFPMPFHHNAKDAAQAALCAREQKPAKFWIMHDLLFENQSQLDKDNLKQLAGQAKLDLKKFNSCLSSNKHLATIAEDQAEGNRVHVKSTPTFFVNGQLVMGAQDPETFFAIIDEELTK